MNPWLMLVIAFVYTPVIYIIGYLSGCQSTEIVLEEQLKSLKEKSPTNSQD